LEAVTVDRERKTISMATLGQIDAEEVTQEIAETVQKAGECGRCNLLEGKENCGTCGCQLSEFELRRIEVRQEAATTTISRVTCPTAPKLWRWRNVPWPKVAPRRIEFLDEDQVPDEWKFQMAAALVCGGLGLSGWLLEPGRWAVLLYLLSYFAGAWFPAQEVWERLRQRVIDVHFLMLAVAAGSASIGAWGEGAMLLFLFSFSGALEHYAMGRTQREIRSLFRESPKTATLVEAEGRETEVPVENLVRGNRLLIKPGAQFPVDAEISKGQTAADESNLTGEAVPVEKKLGDLVLAGTLNLWGAVEVSVLRPASESSLRKIIRLIKEAQNRKAPSQRFTDKFGVYYTYFALCIAVLMFFVWWLAMGLSPIAPHEQQSSAFYRTMTLLVVASPCALVLSIPSAVLAAIAWGARHGILFRGGAAVEKMAATTSVALDKTGTLTTGELAIERVESFPNGREAEVARLAFSLERLSHHPLARAITRYGKDHGLQAVPLEAFESITGVGLKGRYRGQECVLGKREWLQTMSFGKVIEGIPRSAAGCSAVWVGCGDLLGRIVLTDDIRPEARRTVDLLKAAGLRLLVLTGDRKAAAEGLQQHLNLEEVRAELKPEQKLQVIQELSAKGEKVAMIGDGVNDAPSLAAAHIGVAMGARGADAALEQADVVLMHDRLENFLTAFRLSQRARRIIRQNLVISMGTVVVLMGFALWGRIPLTMGVVGHEGSTVVVVMNSLRLLLGQGLTKGGKGG
jgi:Cd2+/Zn2+-exporting ATPase